MTRPEALTYFKGNNMWTCRDLWRFGLEALLDFLDFHIWNWNVPNSWVFSTSVSQSLTIK